MGDQTYLAAQGQSSTTTSTQSGSLSYQYAMNAGSLATQHEAGSFAQGSFSLGCVLYQQSGWDTISTSSTDSSTNAMVGSVSSYNYQPPRSSDPLGCVVMSGTGSAALTQTTSKSVATQTLGTASYSLY